MEETTSPPPNGEQTPAPIRLSALYPQRQRFEFADQVWEILSPVELDLPDIAKASHLSQEIQDSLVQFRAGKYKPLDPEGVDLEKFRATLRSFTHMLVPDMPEEVLMGMKWVEHLLVLGLWQRSGGQDFMLSRLAELLPPSGPTKTQATASRGAQNGKRSRTSQTPSR